MRRLLFCSYHCYWDQSSGAALCTRELLELLAQRGWSCRVWCGPHLDFEDAPEGEKGSGQVFFNGNSSGLQSALRKPGRQSKGKVALSKT